eukprot:354736-Chlamydomonas_euryale.AAC.10
MDVVLAVTACRCTGFSSAPAQRWCRILHAPAAVLSSAYLRLGLVFSCLPPLPPLACVSCLLLLLVSGCTMGALALPPTFSSSAAAPATGKQNMSKPVDSRHVRTPLKAMCGWRVRCMYGHARHRDVREGQHLQQPMHGPI